MSKLNVITGAGGLLGSHIAEQLLAAGERVRAPVRSGSDSAFLRQIGVEVVDAADLRAAFQGADVVYNCAARVSDWGSWKHFRDEATTLATTILDACRAARVPRLLHVSSISVYGFQKADAAPIAEDAPLGRRFMLWDYYPRAKLLAEDLVRGYEGAWTIVRPSWIYGPRDRTTLPRLVPALRKGKVPVIGSGDNLLNLIYAGDVAAGAILAANNPAAVGQAYNLSSEGEVTQRKLLDTLTDALALPRITKKVPFGLARWAAFFKELFGKMTFRKTPPTITRRAIYLVGRPPRFSTAKARAQLGWSPKVGIEEGVRQTLEWLFEMETKTAESRVSEREA